MISVRTSAGPARVTLDGTNPAFLMVLTHGSGGTPGTPDVLAARDAGLALGGAVALVTQPYQVRGSRAPGSAARQDAAWAEIISALRRRVRKRGAGRQEGGAGRQEGGAGRRAGGAELPLIQGGRSNGARVACRTARAVGARGVVALAFPLHPPGHPERSRAAELREAGTDVLVINGDRDPFGIPEKEDASSVIVLPGETHALSKNPAAVADAVSGWLREILGTPVSG